MESLVAACPAAASAGAEAAMKLTRDAPATSAKLIDQRCASPPTVINETPSTVGKNQPTSSSEEEDPAIFALTKLTVDDEARISALVKKATSRETMGGR
jgi:hypothetical protein